MDRLRRAWMSFSGQTQSPDVLAETPLVDQYKRYHRDAGKEGFSFFVAVCFTVNYIMGSGFLGVPRGFYEAGIFASILLMVGVTLFANVTKNFILDAMLRAEALSQDRLLAPAGGSTADDAAWAADVQSTSRFPRPPLVDLVPVDGGASPGAGRSRSSLMERGLSGASARSLSDGGHEDERLGVSRGRPAFEVTGRKFEVAELVALFVGKRARAVYVAMLCIYMYGALWAYAAVFSSSFASSFAGGMGVSEEEAYLLFLALFSCLVVFASCLDLAEQVCVQVAMSVARFLVIAFMVASVLVAAADPGKPFFEDVPAGGEGEWTWLRPSGLAFLLPILVYSQIFHHSIPGLSQPVADKRQLPSIFAAAFTVTASFYIAIGVAVTWHLGPHVKHQCNINWAGFMGNDAGVHPAAGPTNATLLATQPRDLGDPGAPPLAQAVSLFVVLFPGLDVLSAYPLAAITLGSNLLSACCGRRVAKYERSRVHRIPFRLLAAVPPLIGASVVHDLGTILDLAGLVGFAIIFFMPVALQHYSRKACIERWGADLGAVTPLTQPVMSRPRVMIALVSIAAVALVVTIVSLVAGAQ